MSPRQVFFGLLACLGFLVTGCGSGHAPIAPTSPGGGSPAGPATQDVSITVQPASQVVPIGTSATFTVTASGTAPLTYQWTKNGVPVAGANGASYSTPIISVADGGSSFQVIVSNAASSAASNLATLTAGPRAPREGDLRYLLFQQASYPGLGAGGGEATEVLPGLTTWFNNTLGSPLEIGSSGVCGPSVEYDCAWAFFVENLPQGQSGLTMYYQGHDYPDFDSDLQSILASNVVINCLDFEPDDNAYGVAWVQTSQTGGFDARREIVPPDQIAATAAQDGSESRIVTAVSFDAQGQANLFSYGWQSDTTTVYETEVTTVSPADVAYAATVLANAGYAITAFGGNDTLGYVLVGTRVQGDTLPRPLTIYANSATTSTAVTPTESVNSTPVVRLFAAGNGDLLINEY